MTQLHVVLNAMWFVAQALVDFLLGIYLLSLILSLGRTLISWVVGSLRPGTAWPSQASDVVVVIQPQGRVSAFLMRVAWFYVYSASWPVMRPVLTRFNRYPSEIQRQARLAISPIDLRIALFDVSLIAVVIGLAVIRLGWDQLELWALAAVFGAVAARLLSYLVGPLLPRLRKSSLDPEKYFLAIVAVDFAALSLGVAAVFEAHLLLRPTPDNLIQAAIDILSLNRILPIPSPPGPHAPVYVVSALFYGVALKSLFVALTRGGFDRSAEECCDLAFAYAQLGDYRQSRSWLASVHRHSTETHLVSAAVEVGLGNYDEALEYGRQASTGRPGDDETDAALRAIWRASLSLPLEQSTRLQFMSREIGWRASDATIAIQIAQCGAFGLIGTDDLGSTFAERLNERDFPVSRSLALSLANDLTGAIRLLEKATPGSEIEEAMRLIYLPTFRVLSTLKHLQGPDAEVELSAAFAEWVEKEFSSLRSACLGLGLAWQSAALSLLIYFRTLTALIAPHLHGSKDEIGEAMARLDELIHELEKREEEVNRYAKAWRRFFQFPSNNT